MNTSITIGTVTIHQSENGLYSLKDLWIAGSKRKAKQASDFMKLKSTQEMICALWGGKVGFNTNQIVIKIEGSPENGGGTYVCKDLAYAYAMWLSPQFYILVVRTFDAVINATSPEEMQTVKDQLAWSMGELTQIQARHPKDPRTLSAILGKACSQVYPYFRHLVSIGELEQVRIQQPDKIIYIPTQQSKSVVGRKGDTLLFDEKAIKALLPRQCDWTGGAL